MPKHPTPVFRGRIDNGKICLEQREDFAARVARLDGCEIDLILRKHRNIRSLRQNAYYWGVVIPLLANHIGDDDEAVHRALANEFLQRHIEVETRGSWKTLTTVRSTAELSTVEFTEYIEQCRRLAAEMGVVIPSPGFAE